MKNRIIFHDDNYYSIDIDLKYKLKIWVHGHAILINDICRLFVPPDMALAWNGA